MAAADPANGGSAEPAPPLDARQQAAEAAKELVTSQARRAGSAEL